MCNSIFLIPIFINSKTLRFYKMALMSFDNLRKNATKTKSTFFPKFKFMWFLKLNVFLVWFVSVNFSNTFFVIINRKKNKRIWFDFNFFIFIWEFLAKVVLQYLGIKYKINIILRSLCVFCCKVYKTYF